MYIYVYMYMHMYIYAYIYIYIYIYLVRCTCSSPYLVHFKNDAEYLTRGTAQVFIIPLRRFLTQNLDLRSFLLHSVGHFSYFFFPFCLFNGVRFQCSKALRIFILFSVFWCFLPLFLFFQFPWHIFLQKIPFLYTGCIFLFSVSGSPILFYFLANNMISFIYVRWLIFSCDFVNF